MPKYPSSLPASGQAAREWLLDLIFKDRKPLAWIASVKDVDAVGAWTGSRYGGRIALNPDNGHYVCIATIEPSATKRREDDVEAVNVVVLDDVGNDSRPDIKLDEDVLQLIPIPPSYVIETSSLNYQVGFVLDPPVTRQEYDALIADMKHHPELRDGIKDGTTSVRYVRLPSGANPKPGKGAFATRLVEASGRTYSLGELRKAFNLVAPAARTQAAPASVSADVPEALRLPEAQALALLEEIYAEIRNNGIGREDWIGLVFAAWNASGGSEDSLAIIEAWTATREDGDVNPGKDIRDVWDHRLGTKAGVTTLIRGLEEYGRAGAEAMIEKIKQVQAKGVFDPVDNGDGADTASTDTGVGEDPDTDAETVDDVNLVLDQVDFEHDELEIIIEGFERSHVTLVGGPSGAMKSLFMEQLAMALVAEQAGPTGLAKIDYCGPVVYFANEDAPGQVMKRFDAIRRRHRLRGPFPWKLSIRTGRLLSRKGGVITLNKAEAGILEKMSREGGLALVVVDTLAAALVSEETNLEFQMTMNLLRRLARRTGAAIAVVHHFRKGAPGVKDKNEESSLESVRGGSALTASARHVLFVERPSKNNIAKFGLGNDAKRYMKLTEEKSSSTETGSVRWFKLETEAIPVVDRRDGTQKTENAPALVPVNPEGAAHRMAMNRDALAKLAAAVKAGRNPRVMDRGGRHPDSVANITGLDAQEAKRVIDELVNLGKVVIREIKVNRNPIDVIRIEDENWAETLDDEEDET
jgi:hypothetical protein